MKIKFGDRVILFFGGLLSMIAGPLLTAWSLWRVPDFIPDEPAGWVRTLCATAGVLTALFGVYLLFFLCRRPKRRQDFVVQKSDQGELRIAVKAIESQVRKCIELHEEIRLVSMDILNPRSGVAVDLRIALANNISIPLAVASLQKQIKQYLAASSGIEVREVRVSVEATEDGLEPKSSSHSGAAAPAEEENAAPVRVKPPLQQRLFSKAGQPAARPEPPRESKDAMAAWRPPETELATEKPEADQDIAAAPAAPQDAADLGPRPGPERTGAEPDQDREDHSHE